MEANSPFRSSPFSIVADETAAACWAGRAPVLAKLHRLCQSWTKRSDSTLDVVWSNLGAGKTHLLFHLRYLLSKQPPGSPETLVIYAEVPEQNSRFIELYRRLMSTVDTRAFARWVVTTGAGADGVSNVSRACRAIALGGENERRVAQDWLLAARPGLRDLKTATGIDSRIETDADAERVLRDVLTLAAGGRLRVVVLLDEFQRLGHLNQRAREALLSHIRALFSARSSFFSMLIAVGSRMEKTAIDLLPSELQTIVGMRPSISLPEMNVDEARTFVLERLRWFRPEGYSGTEHHPFTERQVDVVLSYIAEEAKARLIPRTILQVFGIIYDEAVDGHELKMDQEALRILLDALRWDDASASD